MPEKLKNIKDIYLIRHGQSQWQVGESTSKDSDITDLGMQQSHYLNQHVKHLIQFYPNEYIIYASPQRRAMQTVQGLHKEFFVEKRLKEAPFHVAKKLPQFQTPHLYERKTSNDANYQVFKNTLKQVLHGIMTQTAHHKVYLYTHGGVIKTILRIIHDNDALCYTIYNCSMTKLTWHRSRWHLESLNDVSFLPKAFIT